MKRSAPLRRVGAKGRRTKGGRGEKEVSAIWRSWGFEKAVATPGSGGLRPAGAGDLSPWPGDIHAVAPFLVEVKYDERVKQNSRGWTGEAFIRQTARDLEKLWARHDAVVGGPKSYPVIMARANFMAWDFWTPAWVLYEGMALPSHSRPGWVCLGPVTGSESDPAYELVISSLRER